MTSTPHDDAPFVLTLGFDAKTFDILNGLRRAHFPRHRNHIPAHTTLFHALPGEHEALIRQVLEETCAQSQPLKLGFPKLHQMSKGVAVVLDCPELAPLRASLASTWQHLLTEQDRRPHSPHVTIQNKVEPDQARALFHRLADSWEPFEGRGESLLLWRYRGGPWEAAGEFRLG